MRNQLYMKYPASWHGAAWREAIPAGNGTIGAAVYGAVHDETVLITHEDLWWGCCGQTMPDISCKLPEMRERLLAGDIEGSEYILINALKEKGYRHSVACPLPLGDLKIKMPCEHAFKNYSRILDMGTGEVTVKWFDGDVMYERNLFVSRPKDTIILKISSSRQGNIDASITLDLHDLNDSYKLFGLPKAPIPESAETFCADGFICYAAKNDDGTDFGAVARVINNSGSINYSSGLIHVRNADSVTILIKVFIKGERSSQWKQLRSQLKEMDSDYSTLFQPHAEVHGKLFNSVSFGIESEADSNKLSNEELLLQGYQGEVPLAMMNKMWSFGRYLLISSSRPGGNPCSLLGLWCGEYEGFWSFNMANENIQMIYWQALTGNMPELLMAVFDYYDGMKEAFRINARNLYGCRGIFIPAVTTPGEGLLQCLLPHIIHWTGAAAWLAQHYYDYYLFTLDEKFLRERALPFMYETALFYEDFFILGKDGYYVSAPSNSPENTPGNYLSEGQTEGIKTTINSTMDFALAKEVLTHLIEGAGITGLYSECIDRWKDMVSHIPPYQINEDGAVKEWMHPLFKDNYYHRHQSHLYPIFPGNEITKESDPDLFDAFVTAVRKRLIIGLGEQTTWSLAHMACVYARMGEGDLALECLDILSRSAVLHNFYTVHNDWRKMGISMDFNISPVQLDANMGWTAAVNEMLIFSKPGLIKVLPALPGRWKKGDVKGLLCRGGIIVDIEWNIIEKILNIGLVSKVNQEVTIKLPGVISSINGDFEWIESTKLSFGSEYLSMSLPKEKKLLLKISFN